MTTTNSTSTSGDKTGTSGSGSGSDGDKGAQTYPKEFVDKLKGELDNHRTKNKELEDKLAAQATADLEKKNEYKTLYEQQQKRNADLEAQIKERTEKEAGRHKKDALVKELLTLGLDPKFTDDALKLATVKNLSIDPDTNVVFGAQEEAKGFLEKYQNLGFFKGKGKTTANHSAPRDGTKSISGLDLSKMSQNEKMAALRDIHKK